MPTDRHERHERGQQTLVGYLMMVGLAFFILLFFIIAVCKVDPKVRSHIK